MLEALGMLANSEYENSAELFSLGEMDNELMGYLNSLDAVTRHKVIKKLTSGKPASKGSRAEFEKFMGELPANIKQGLRDQKLRLADTVIYSMKPVNGSKTIKMFETQDVKEVGLRNISNGRLPKNSALLVSGIILLQGVAASLSADDQKSTITDVIDTVGALSSGEFTLKANKKQIVDSISNYVFRTQNFTSVTKGYYKLANPRLIHDDVDIEWEIELGTVTGVSANTILWGGLHGTITIP